MTSRLGTVLRATFGVALAATLVLSAAGAAQAADAITAGDSCTANETTGCVQGTLKDGNSNGVAGVGVTLSDDAGDTATATTTDEGTFIFTVTQEGDYALTLDETTLPEGVTATNATSKVSVTLGQLNLALPPLKLDGASKDSVDTRTKAPSAGQLVWNQFSQGLLLGMLLALAAIGLSLIYGTTGLSNFAHAEQVTLGGMMAYFFGIVLGLPIGIAAIIAVIVGGASGWVQDRFLWGPLRRRGLGLNQLMVVTIGLSLAAQYLFAFFFGTEPHTVVKSSERIGGPLQITPSAYVAMLISLIVLVLVGLALTRTRIGRATRAVSDNRALAAASGIDVDRIIRLVWTIAMALAALSGVLYAIVNGGIQWSTGAQLLLLLFAAVTLGGLGTSFGALVGSLVIGVLVQMSSLVVSGDLKYASALIVLILILLFRPQGILGRRERVG